MKIYLFTLICIFASLCSATGCHTSCNGGKQALNGECVELCQDAFDCEDETRFACIGQACNECVASTEDDVTGGENCVAYIETLKLLDGATNILESFDPSENDYSVASSIFVENIELQLTTQPGATVQASIFGGATVDLTSTPISLGDQMLMQHSGNLEFPTMIDERQLLITSEVLGWSSTFYIIDITRGSD